MEETMLYSGLLSIRQWALAAAARMLDADIALHPHMGISNSILDI